MNVHVIQTGRLLGNRTFLRATGWSALLRRREPFEFPVFAYVIEHPEGTIAIDTGMSTRARTPFTQRRFVPRPTIAADEELGPQMRRRGIDPAAVRRVVLTHLDWDHAGGLAHLPNAQVLLHRAEHDFAGTLTGRMRYRPALWPHGFAPELYDLDESQPYGPFPASWPITRRGDVRAVPLGGHSAGQIGVVVETGGPVLFFVADHVLRADWFAEDYAAGRMLGLGIFYAEAAVETSRRIHELASRREVVLLPAHDADAPARLAAALQGRRRDALVGA